MNTLRPTTRKLIVDKLDETKLKSLAFNISFPEGEDNASFLEVSYRFMPIFSFTGVRDKGYRGTSYSVTVNPGIHFNEPTKITCESVDEVIKQLIEWVNRIVDELKSLHPINAEFESFREYITEKINSLGDIGAKPFSETESGEWKGKISELEKRILELEKKAETSPQDRKSIQSDITELKADVDSMPRAVWLTSLGGFLAKVMKLLSSSPELRKSLGEGAKQLFLK